MDNGVVRDINGLTVSLSGLSLEFGIARETVARRLAFAGVGPGGESSGHPVFRLGPAARALVMAELPDGAGAGNPEEMKPQDRKAWYQSEKDRLAVEQQQGVLVVADDCRKQMAQIVMATVHTLDTLEDVLERDAGMDLDQLKVVARVIEQARAQWAETLDAG